MEILEKGWHNIQKEYHPEFSDLAFEDAFALFMLYKKAYIYMLAKTKLYIE